MEGITAYKNRAGGFFTELVGFFLPQFCSGCNCKLQSNEKHICSSCINSIQRADKKRISLEFERKFKHSAIISDFTSLFVFEKDKELQNIIHSFKYNKKFSSAVKLGEIMGSRLSTDFLNWNIDAIVPVPLHKLKKAERGFNQSYYIAKGISRQTNIIILKNILKRIRYTESQTALSLTEREINISNAFKVSWQNKIEDKTLLLIDDVITTGATIRECGKALLNGGARAVYAASIAIAG